MDKSVEPKIPTARKELPLIAIYFSSRVRRREAFTDRDTRYSFSRIGAADFSSTFTN
jgi:hypothetical protein